MKISPRQYAELLSAAPKGKEYKACREAPCEHNLLWECSSCPLDHRNGGTYEEKVVAFIAKYKKSNAEVERLRLSLTRLFSPKSTRP